jgi:hypothetical protein
MFDVNCNAVQPDAATKIGPSGEDNQLIQICGEFWSLENSKASLVSGEDVIHLSPESNEKLRSLQLQLAGTLRRIRRSSVNSLEAFNEKLRVLKYLAAATDFQDSDIFRELVAFLDDWDIGACETACPRWQKPHEGPDTKRIWKFTLHNIFGIFNN